MKKVSILGSGSWGTALALVLEKNGYKIDMWTLNQEQADYINDKRENVDYLPGINIPDNIRATTNLKEVIEDSEIIVLAVPSQAIRSICKKIQKFVNSNQILVDVAKGIENDTGMRLSEICKQELPNNKYVVLSGPSHAEEVSRNIPTTVVVSSEDLESAKIVQDAFMNSNFRVYVNEDTIGVELGGALKNIIAFGAGICDGLGYGDNAKAALMTRGIREISRLGVAMGAKESTFSGLSGVGDLIVTCTSMHSRNRRAGILIGQGKSLEETLDEVKMVVEGITATKAAYEISKKLGVDMPITSAIYSVLYNGSSPDDIVAELMTRRKVYEIEDFL